MIPDAAPFDALDLPADALPAEAAAHPTAGQPVLRLGLIRNRNSQRNRERAEAEALPQVEGIELTAIEPRSIDDLPEVVRALHAQGVRHLVVDGGDGTLREVMSALPPIYGTALPTLTLLAGGNANLTSSDVGTPGHGADALRALMHALREPDGGQRMRRRPVEVRWPDGSRAPVLGFFVGAAGFYRGWKIAVGSVRDRGFLHGAGVAVALAAAAWQALTGSSRNEWQAGQPMDVEIDGEANPEGARFLFLATSLHHLFGPLWPFFDHGEHTLRWLDVAAPPPRFALALPALLRGQPKPWMRASGAYRSGGAERIALRLESPLVIDGEAFTPGPYGVVELHSGPEIEFYTPMIAR